MNEKKKFDTFGLVNLFAILVAVAIGLAILVTNNKVDNVVETIQITFELNDGTNEKFNQTVAMNSKLEKPENPTREGYNFDGWYNDDEKWSFIGYSVTKKLTLTAKWEPIVYTITYDLNDTDTNDKATNNLNNPTTYTIEDEITFEAPLRDNSTFIGWSTEKIDKGSIGDMVIQAQWSVEYFISFDSNGGTDVDSFVSGKDMEVSLLVPTRGEDTFVAWFDGKNYLTNTSVFTGDTSLFAVWLEDFDYTENEDGTINIVGYKGEGQRVVLPSNVKEIKENAFKGNTVVTSVYIPEGVTYIGDNAFDGCISLQNITLPNSLEDIADHAFDGCEAIEYYQYDNGLYLGNDTNNYVWFIKRTSTSIPYCNINDSTVHVYIDAFYGCTNLARISIPNGVRTIGEYAFYECRSLKDILIPNSVEKIGAFAFYKCNFIEKVKTLDLTSWCNIEFCDAYANPTFYSHSLYLSNDKVTNLVIPDGVNKIGSYSFYSCKDITHVTIPESVTSIGVEAFAYCEGLTSVSILETVKSLGNNVFMGCNALRYNEAGGCQYLGNKDNEYVWFMNVISASEEQCTINKKTKHIYQKAFDGCESLTYVFYDGNMADFLTIAGDLKFNYAIKCDDGTIAKSS